jgi:hypothetical protein
VYLALGLSAPNKDKFVRAREEEAGQRERAIMRMKKRKWEEGMDRGNIPLLISHGIL